MNQLPREMRWEILRWVDNPTFCHLLETSKIFHIYTKKELRERKMLEKTFYQYLKERNLEGIQFYFEKKNYWRISRAIKNDIMTFSELIMEIIQEDNLDIFKQLYLMVGDNAEDIDCSIAMRKMRSSININDEKIKNEMNSLLNIMESQKHSMMDILLPLIIGFGCPRIFLYLYIMKPDRFMPTNQDILDKGFGITAQSPERYMVADKILKEKYQLEHVSSRFIFFFLNTIERVIGYGGDKAIMKYITEMEMS